MPTAEWFEQQANKIKANTWKESDRFNKFDRLNLTLANKLSKIKPLLKEYETDPAKQYSLSEGDKQTIATLKKYSPSLFKEAPAFTPEKYAVMASEQKLKTKQKTAQSTIEKMGLAGLIKKPGEALIAASKKGYLPDIENKNFWGKQAEAMKFPLQKLMHGLNMFERFGAATGLKAGELQPETSQLSTMQKWGNINKNPQTVKDLIYTPTPMKEPEGGYKNFYKEVFKAGWQGLINQKGSPYENAQYKDVYEMDRPWTAEDFKGTEGWDKGNWAQRLFSGFAGSPSDILGLLTSIGGDPFMHAGAGLGKGAKTGAFLIDDFVKGGTKILPKGAEIGLTKAGRAAAEVFTKAKYGNVIDDIAKGVIKTASGATDDIAKATMLNALKNKAINEFVQQIPDVYTAKNLLDFGGTKFMGQTVIPGYKYAQQFGKLKNKGVVQTLGKLFNENADIPGELVPFKNWLLSAGEAEKAASMKEFATIIKGADKADLDKVQKYMWQMADIEKQSNKLPIIKTKYDDITNVLNREIERVRTQINNPKNVIPFVKDADVDVVKYYLQNPKLYANEIPKKFGGLAPNGSTPFTEQTWASAALDINKKVSKDLVAGTELDNSLFKKIIKGTTEGLPDKPYKYLESIQNKITAVGNREAKVIGRVDEILAKYADKIKEFALTNKQLGVADNLTNFWKKQVAYFTEATGKPLKAYDIYSPIRYVKEEAATGLKSTMLGAIDQPFVKARNITMAQAERLKLQPKSLVESTIQRLYEQERNVFRSRLLNEVKQFGSDTAQEGMVQIKNIPELAGFHLPKEYEKVFKTTYSTFFGDDAFKNVMKIYDKGLTMWKRWALATPGYHFRNFFTDNVSGLMEYGIDWYNPKHWSNMVRVLKKEHKLITLNGVQRYADDVFKEMVETGELVTQTGIEGLVGSAKGAMKYTPAELSLKFGVKREDVGRVLAGVIERDAGSSKIMAAANVKKVFFDYAHSLTPFEKNIVKRAIPFYTWMKNNLRRQVELVFKRTGAYATIPKAMNFVENISDVPEGYDEFKPDYYKDLGAFATPLRNPGLPDWLADLMKKQRTTQAGDMLVANPNLAFQDWSRLNPKDFFSSFAPQLKVLIELLTDKNIYFGSNIVEGQKNKEVAAPIAKLLSFLPASVLEKMGVTKTADGKILVPPRVDYLLKQLPPYALTQRGFAGTENSPFQNLSMLGGIKFFPYNEEKAKTSYTTDWQKEANRQLGSYEQKQGEGYNLPATDDIGRAYKQIYADYLKTKYPKFAVANQIKEMTKYGGKTAEISLLIKLLEKPYNDELDKIKGMSLAELSKTLSDLGINPTMQDVTTILNKLGAAQ